MKRFLYNFDDGLVVPVDEATLEPIPHEGEFFCERLMVLFLPWLLDSPLLTVDSKPFGGAKELVFRWQGVYENEKACQQVSSYHHSQPDSIRKTVYVERATIETDGQSAENVCDDHPWAVAYLLGEELPVDDKVYKVYVAP